MNISIITARAADGPLTVEVTDPQFPQNVAGVVWRYTPAKQPDGQAGQFTPLHPAVPIGTVQGNAGRFFLVEGAVLHQDDDPPTPYQVVVTVRQPGKVLSEEVPSAGGGGQVGDKDQPFVYRFQIQEAP